MIESVSAVIRHRAGILSLATLFAVSAPLASLGAQVRYTERPFLSERHRAGVTFDVLRGRMVLFGGATSRTGQPGSNLNDTWEADTGGWVRRAPLSSPPGSDQSSAIAYDAANKRVVHFTFSQATRQGETWRHDGRSWSRFLGLTNTPQFRLNYATAFDPVRSVLVLFGGSDTSGALLDTWEFNGLDWRQITTPGPTGRDDPAMAYDETRNRVLLFGGRDAAQMPLNDTWEWDGAAWSRLTPANAPLPRHSSAMAFDGAHRRVVLFGGATGLPGTRFDDTWVWDGTNWSQRAPANHPSARNGHAMTYRTDRQRVVVVAGDGQAGLLSDTWQWDGTNWTEAIAAAAPARRSEHASCFDSVRGEVLLFGGRVAVSALAADTWAWRLGSWRELHPTSAPPARSDHAMEFDAARGQVVVFGGSGLPGELADTWLWDGAAWTQANPTNAPPPRVGHAMVYDSARQVIVMFGGSRNAVVLDDLWEWNGTNWTALTPTQRPQARMNHGMVYDPGTQQMVLFGGRNGFGGKLNDTWVWDGSTGAWTQRTGAVVPTARDNFAMWYDPARQRVTLYSGFGASSYLSDTWDWNGSNWSSVFVFPSPTPRQGVTVTYDGAGRHAVMFGGNTSTGFRQETWLFTTHPAAQVLPHGRACAGAQGLAILTGFGNPTIGSAEFAIELVTPTPATVVPVFFVLTTAAGSVTFGNCTLAVDPSTAFHTAQRFQFGVGFASMGLPIPANVSLRGVQFYAVAAYVDPPTQFLGLAFAQQARIVIGD